MPDITAGSVTIQVKADLSPLEQALARAKTLASSFDTQTKVGNGIEKSVAPATVALVGLQKAAAPSRAAIASLEKATAPASVAIASLGKTSAPASVALATLDKAATSTARAHGGLSTQAMSAQHAMRGFIEMTIQGISPLRALEMEFNNIAYAASGPRGLTGAFKEAFSIFGQITAMKVGLVGLGAAVALGAGIFFSWKNFALALDDTARSAGVTTAAMAKLQAAAAFKGIDQSDFADAMKTFSANVYEAQHGMGELAQAFRANGVQAKGFTDSLDKAADLIKRATSDQQRLQLLQQLGLPATMQWVRLLEGGSQALHDAESQAAAFNSLVNDKMVESARRFDEAWNKALTNLGTEFRSLAISAVDWVRKLDQALEDSGINSVLRTINGVLGMTNNSFAGQVGRRFEGLMPDTGGSALKNALRNKGRDIDAAMNNEPFPPPRVEVTTADSKAIIAANNRYIQRISLLGQLATADQQVKARELELQNVYLQTGVALNKNETEALARITRLQVEQSRLQQQMQFGIFDPAKFSSAASLQLQVLKDQGLVKTAQDIGAYWAVAAKNIKAASDAAEIARSPFEQLTRYYLDGANLNKQFDQFATSGMTNFEDALVNAANGTKTLSASFSDMAKSILSDLERMIIRMEITAPLAKSISGVLNGGGGIGGFFSSLFGGSSSAVAAAGSAVPAGFTGGLGTLFDVGGYTGSIDRRLPAGIVHGQEYVFDAVSTSRIGVANLDAIRRNVRGYANGGFVGTMPAAQLASVPVSHKIDITVNVSGARGSKEIKDAVSAGTREAVAHSAAMLRSYDAHLPLRLGQIQTEIA